MDNGEIKYLESIGLTGEHALKIIEIREEYRKPNHGKYNDDKPSVPA